MGERSDACDPGGSWNGIVGGKDGQWWWRTRRGAAEGTVGAWSTGGLQCSICGVSVVHMWSVGGLFLVYFGWFLALSAAGPPRTPRYKIFCPSSPWILTEPLMHPLYYEDLVRLDRLSKPISQP